MKHWVWEWESQSVLEEGGGGGEQHNSPPNQPITPFLFLSFFPSFFLLFCQTIRNISKNKNVFVS